ncbi:MAG: DUF4956 domain-containing protein [Pseudomonadales bacterium]
MRQPLLILSFKLALFYTVTFGGLLWLVLAHPETRAYLPVGGIDQLSSSLVHSPTTDSTLSPQYVEERAIVLLTALAGGIIFVLPILSCYQGTRKKVRPAIVEAMLLLPVVVTTVVFVVQNSIALAFSLAGIVAAVRFRYTLQNPADAVFIFAAIVVGLAAGVREVGVAGAGSIAFTFTALALAYLRAESTPTESAEDSNSR